MLIFAQAILGREHCREVMTLGCHFGMHLFLVLGVHLRVPPCYTNWIVLLVLFRFLLALDTLKSSDLLQKKCLRNVKKNKENKFKHYHLLGAGFTCWTIWQISTILGIVLGSVVPEELGLSFTISLTFLALLIDDFRKYKNIIVMLVSGIVATVGYNTIPFQAYIIIATLSALSVATIITLIDRKKK